MGVESEKEKWFQIAREWYGAGLAERPGMGKFRHHLVSLERGVEDEGFVKGWVFFYQ
jgi:protein SMG6